MLKLDTDMNVLTDMLKDIKYLTDQQDVYIETIENHVLNSQCNVNKGKKNIQSARKYRKFSL